MAVGVVPRSCVAESGQTVLYMYKYRWVAFLGDRKVSQRKTKCYRIRGGALFTKIAFALLEPLSFVVKIAHHRGPWCLDPPMLGDPKMRPTEVRMTPAAPHDEDSRITRSRSHTRTSVQQHSLPTIIRSARTVAGCVLMLHEDEHSRAASVHISCSYIPATICV